MSLRFTSHLEVFGRYLVPYGCMHTHGHTIYMAQLENLQFEIDTSGLGQDPH